MVDALPPDHRPDSQPPIPLLDPTVVSWLICDTEGAM